MIDQITHRRIMRTGVTAFDRELADPGYVLFCPSFWGNEVRLIDLKGRVVHTWATPYWPRHWGYLLPNGHLFFMGRWKDAPHEFPGWDDEIGGAMLEFDWDGNVVWSHFDRNQHHDARRTQEGGALYLTVERVRPKIAARVIGGQAPAEQGDMWADVIVEVDAAGRRIWEWRAEDHLDPDEHVLPPNVPRHEWSHANTIVPLSQNEVMVSFRHISTIAIIDKRSGDIVWQVGHETVSGQHDPCPVGDDRILVFDNGIFRRDTHSTFSRVLEIDRRTKEVVWTYSDSPRTSFYSPFIGGAQRLPNGNTLITEGWFGRIFQVAPDGSVVWEYVNPTFQNKRNSIFRARHYRESELPGLGA